MNVYKSSLLAIILILVFGITNTGAEPVSPPIHPIPNSEFKEIVPIPVRPLLMEEATRFDNDFAAYEPSISIPANHGFVSVTSPKPKQSPAPVKNLKNLRKGVASYYCLRGRSRCTRGYSGGLYAAIRKDLLFLRGKYVRVCTFTKRCVTVKIIDCNCGPHANLIDLYSDAFRRLVPLSRGVVKVTVRW